MVWGRRTELKAEAYLPHLSRVFARGHVIVASGFNCQVMTHDEATNGCLALLMGMFHFSNSVNIRPPPGKLSEDQPCPTLSPMPCFAAFSSR